MGEAKRRGDLNGGGMPGVARVEAELEAAEANVGALESVQAMINELTEQNNILRARAVNFAGQVARANAVIARRDALIKELRAVKFGEKEKRDAGEASRAVD